MHFQKTQFLQEIFTNQLRDIIYRQLKMQKNSGTAIGDTRYSIRGTKDDNSERYQMLYTGFVIIGTTGEVCLRVGATKPT